MLRGKNVKNIAVYCGTQTGHFLEAVRKCRGKKSEAGYPVKDF
jgi:hypothetical protein